MGGPTRDQRRLLRAIESQRGAAAALEFALAMEEDPSHSFTLTLRHLTALMAALSEVADSDSPMAKPCSTVAGHVYTQIPGHWIYLLEMIPDDFK